MVAVSSRLILASGCGSVLGPLIGMSLMRRSGIDRRALSSSLPRRSSWPSSPPAEL